MTINVPAQGVFRDQFLTDISNQYFDQGINVPIVPGSDFYIEGTALDNLMQQQVQYLLLLADDTNEQTASGDALAAIRDNLGLAEIDASPSSGRLVVTITGGGLASFPDGTEFSLPNGKLGQVNGSQSSIANGGTVSVVTIDTGADTNQDAGTQVKWVAPPTNVQVVATVDIDGLTGGTDVEDDAHLRDRISTKRKFTPASANWSYIAQILEGSTNAIQKSFVYPALGGPGSVKAVVQKAMVIGSNYSHQLNDLSLPQNAILADFPEFAQIAVQSVIDQPVDVALQLSLPTANSASASNGWFNSTPFPGLTVSDLGVVTVSTVTNTTNITISALTAVAPAAGSTSITWCNPVTREFVSSVVSSFTGSSGAWSLVLASPLTSGGTDIATGDYIFPTAFNGDDYLATWLDTFNSIGPGENTAEEARLPRAARHPFTSDSYGSDLNITQLNSLVENHNEIVDATYSFRSATTPTIPASIDDAPSTFSPRKFAIYKKI